MIWELCFRPRSFVGVRRGAEAAVLTASWYLGKMDTTKKNAQNVCLKMPMLKCLALGKEQ